MDYEINPIIGILGFLVLVVLPGAWITFGLNLPGLSFRLKLLIGITLSPLLVLAQFYLFRLLGVSFGLTSLLLVALNLPPIYLIIRKRGRIRMPQWQSLVGPGLVMLLALASLSLQLLNPQTRLFTGHAWMHTDTIYMLANGELVPDDPDLAGVRQAYPWAGHVYQGVLSYLLDSPPAASYIWTNVLWLIFIYGLMAGVVAELGGNRFSRVSVGFWLFFGLNFIGYPLSLGDYRYTPWLFKFVFFSQMPLVLGMFAAVLFLLVRKPAEALSKTILVVTGLLLSGIGIFYPILFAPACALVGAKGIALLLDQSDGRAANRYRQVLWLAIVLFVSGIITVGHFRFVVEERTITDTIQLNLTNNIVRKIIDGIVAPAAFLAGMALVARNYWQSKRSGFVVLALGGLGSLFLYTVLLIPPVVEYKFMFTAAICLAPFAPLALEPFLERWKRFALPAIAMGALILLAPMARKMLTGWPFIPPERPLVDASGFYLRLDNGESLSPLTNAIRQQTPVNTMIVLEKADISIPTLTSRGLYVPPNEKSYPGYNVSNDHLLSDLRGYDMRIVQDRRDALRQLFDSEETSSWIYILDQLMRFERPVAIVLDKQQDTALLDWLTRESIGSNLYEGDGFVLRLIEPEQSLPVISAKAGASG